MTTTPKKRNPNDLTLRNLRALKKRVAALEKSMRGCKKSYCGCKTPQTRRKTR